MAFANRFEIDMISNIELKMRDNTGQELRRVVNGMSKMIDGRVHTIAQVTWPDRLRGTTVLTIESDARSHDAFVYLPAAKRGRRISTSQRGESFFGTDVTYEDLERRRVGEYLLLSISHGQYQGEQVVRIRAQALVDLTYDQVQFSIATLDGAILEMVYYEQDEAKPLRTVRSPRTYMVQVGDHILPTKLVVENHKQRRVTEVIYGELKLDPVLDNRLFSVTVLDRDRDLPRSEDVVGQTAKPN